MDTPLAPSRTMSKKSLGAQAMPEDLESFARLDPMPERLGYVPSGLNNNQDHIDAYLRQYLMYI